MYAGNITIVLHTHLPYVLHHGDWPHGTDWILEAVAECYIPLLNVCNELLREGIFPKLTFDISPVLCEQLAHKEFPGLFRKYCQEKVNAALRDEELFIRSRESAHQIYLAKYWQKVYSDRLYEFERVYSSSILGEMKRLQDIGAIEVMTCGATHGYFPLLGDDASIELQIKAAVENYKKHFGRSPRGIWLPECAYRPTYDWRTFIAVDHYSTKHLRPGVERMLAAYGLEYFITDDHMLKNGQCIGLKDVDANGKPYVRDWIFNRSPLSIYNVSSDKEIQYGTSIAFTRHRELAMQVWSGDSGYPGDPHYLDFHKKHHNSALRYWRVTDNKADMMYKLLYIPDAVEKKVSLHALHLTKCIEETMLWNYKQTREFGTICLPFDTELFGHWWFEGPKFIKELLRGLYKSPYLNTVTNSEQVDTVQPKYVVALTEGGWGKDGNHENWSNGATVWTWELIYKAELRFKTLLETLELSTIKPTLRRVLTQAMRELMLLQSSDWQFLISTVSAKDYAEQRVTFHNSDFHRLCDIAEQYIKSKKIKKSDTFYVEETEIRNAIFPELQLEWWNTKIYPLQKNTEINETESELSQE
jgi:1,4-alpha-glucan branching enzyme